MKKHFTLALIVITLVTTFAGCKLTECDNCDKKAICRKEEITDEAVFLCKDCLEMLVELRDS